ncbi:MAG TPA: hypothetical protein VNA28_07085 [Solirubrobacteraceae bacterium]|nr:hypothetical protein [Solirubrobacteraceae bacterium]
MRLEVALRCGGNTISGTVDDHCGHAAQFSGWLELMSAFDAICARVGGLPPDDVARGMR